MPRFAIDVWTVFLLVLPGFLAYRFAVLQRPDPSRRSAIWQISEILEHSLYVHLIGIVLAFALHYCLNHWLGVASNLEGFFRLGPQGFLESHFGEATRWYIGYTIYLIFASAIIGSYEIPRECSRRIVDVARWIPEHWRIFGWLPTPKTSHPQEPIWYHAFRQMPALSESTPTESENDVVVSIKLKNSGDVYVGRLTSYPIVPDVEPDKDFLITQAHYYKGGNHQDSQDLAAIDGIGAVLLNSGNVESILVIYSPALDSDSVDDDSE